MRKYQPLGLMAGHALTASTVRAKTSAASGRITATRAALRQPRLLVAAERSRPPAGSGGWPADSACGVAGMLPATPPTVRHLLDGQDLLDRLGLDLEGSAWKLTCVRYVELLPYFGLIRPLQDRADRLGRRALGWCVDTMAYS